VSFSRSPIAKRNSRVRPSQLLVSISEGISISRVTSEVYVLSDIGLSHDGREEPADSPLLKNIYQLLIEAFMTGKLCSLVRLNFSSFSLSWAVRSELKDKK
jgi:hypothetical protein